MSVYLIDGKPHRECRCTQTSEICAQVFGHKRTLQTAGYARCLVPVDESSTPRTDALIAAADACPETRIVFLIKNLANLAKDLERENYRLRILLQATQANYVRDHLVLSELKEYEPPIEFYKCPDGKPCRQTTTGCLKGQCLGRVDKSSTAWRASTGFDHPDCERGGCLERLRGLKGCESGCALTLSTGDK